MCRDAGSRRAGALAAALLATVPLVAAADPAKPDNQSPADPAEAVEVTVRAPPRKRDPGRITLSSDEARREPGTQGDALQAVKALPGVTRAAFDAGKLVVWGTAPRDTRVYVDGVEIPALYHGSGLRGTVNDGLVQSIDVVPGAYEAAYGRGLGGLVRLQTRELPAEGVHGYLAADLLDASGMISAAIGGRLRIAAAGRVGYLDRVLSPFLPEGAGDLVSIPSYRDYQAKASLRLREDEELALTFLGSWDAVDRGDGSADPSRVRRESLESGFHRVFLRYTRALGGGDLVSVTPFFGQDRDAVTERFGAATAGRESTAWRYGARASYRAELSRWIAATAGVDALGTAARLARTGSLTIPAREGDLYVFGQPPGADVNADRWTAAIADVSPYLTADVRLGPVTLSPGLRGSAFLIEGSRLTPRAGATPAIGFSRLTGTLDPRLSVSVAWTSRLTLSAAAGVYHQPPSPEDLSAVFGTPALSLERAFHVSAGQAARLTSDLSIELTGHYARLDHLVVRSRLPAPVLARALTQDGEGQSYGVDVLLRQRPWKGLSGWIAYSVGRSERRYAGDDRYRLFDYDRTSALSIVAGWEHRGFQVGARLRWSTGAPRTPVTASFYEATSGQYQPIFGEQNAIRLPDFFQLDLRVAKRFSLGPVSIEVSLEGLNVTFHRNAEEIVYSADYQKRDFITGMPTLAVLGARVEL